MRYRDGRRSVCVSSQSGCPLTCTFCATGSMKFGRNLSADEILDQALHFRRVEAIDHVVFMGMGEPTMNLDAVLGASERLPDVGVTHRRTAISTVGWVPGIDRLAECEMPVSLALSLHAPNDGLRSSLMPVNDRYPLAEVLAACDRYRARRRRKVFVEYVMLAGVNDLPEHARQLADPARPARLQGQPDPLQPDRRLRRLRARARSSASAPILEEHRLTATVRLTRGRDIAAACGQLAALRLLGQRKDIDRDKYSPIISECQLPERLILGAIPHIDFSLDLRQVPAATWVLLGEAKSKCQHVGRALLSPAAAAELLQVYWSRACWPRRRSRGTPSPRTR